MSEDAEKWWHQSPKTAKESHWVKRGVAMLTQLDAWDYDRRVKVENMFLCYTEYYGLM